MEQHSIYSPSGAHRWFECQMSIVLGKHVRSESSVYAEEGTDAHTLAELWLKDLTLKEIQKGISELEYYSFEMLQHVQVYIDHIKSRSGQKHIEVKTHMPWISKHLFGSIDCLTIQPFDTIYVDDLKYGMNVVEVKDNKQLMIYALGALGEDNEHCVDEVVMTITQPRVKHPDGFIRSHTMSVEELYNWQEKELKPAIHKIENNPEFKTGDHCKWCPIISECPEQNRIGLEIAKSEFSEIKELPDVKLLTVEQMVAIREKQSIITKWLKAVDERLYQKLNNGDHVPGLKLVQKRAYSNWIDKDYAAEELLKRIGVEALQPKTVKQVKGVSDGRDISDLWSSSSSGLTIAKDTDKREDVRKKITDDFD